MLDIDTFFLLSFNINLLSAVKWKLEKRYFKIMNYKSNQNIHVNVFA